MSPYERIEKVIHYIEQRHREQPDLGTLARVAGLSEFHFHRLFSRWAGTTPKSFLKILTSAHAKSLLAKSRDLLDVSLQTGLSGPGRLHDLLVAVEGVTPGEYKAKGEGVEIRYGFHGSPFGTCLVGATRRGVCHFSFLTEAGGKGRGAALRELKERWPRAKLVEDAGATKPAAEKAFKLGRSARNAGEKEKYPVLLSGTPFQIKVWEALLRIPRGNLLSYADIASAIGAPKASRAVGSAVGSNAIGFLIPCHRVIRDTGVIGHYRWGHERKCAMLAWENSEGLAD